MYRKILVPVDLAQETSWSRALPVVLELLEQSGGELWVATIVSAIPDAWWLPASEHDRLVERSIKKHTTTLDELLAEKLPDDLTVHAIVGYGSIYGEILRIADDEQIDLILMASHRPEMKDYLIGPNAARVVRHARCSVLVVR